MTKMIKTNNIKNTPFVIHTFGMPLPGRSNSTDSYRYGFNGMEKDDELKGSGNSYDFGARIHDSRLGRFLSVDPMSNDLPSVSNYNFAGNSPIMGIDFEGKFRIVVTKGAQESMNSETKMTNFETVISLMSKFTEANPNILTEMSKQTGFSKEELAGWSMEKVQQSM
jgi:RHS repeat-associated protein